MRAAIAGLHWGMRHERELINGLDFLTRGIRRITHRKEFHRLALESRTAIDHRAQAESTGARRPPLRFVPRFHQERRPCVANHERR